MKKYSFEKIKEISNDPNFLKEMVNVFKTSVVNDVKSLESNIKKGNIEEIRKTIHKILPSFSYLEMNEYREKIEEISSIAKTTEDINKMTAIYNSFINDFLKTVIDMETDMNSQI